MDKYMANFSLSATDIHSHLKDVYFFSNNEFVKEKIVYAWEPFFETADSDNIVKLLIESPSLLQKFYNSLEIDERNSGHTMHLLYILLCIVKAEMRLEY